MKSKDFYFSSPEDIQTDLEAAAISLEALLASLVLELCPDKAEFLPVFGHKLPKHYQLPTISLAGTAITASFASIWLLGMPISHENSPAICLHKLTCQWEAIAHHSPPV